MGIVFLGIEAIERNGLVTEDAGTAISGSRILPMRIQIGFGARNEERAGHMQRIQSGEIDIASIHHIDDTRLRHKQIECIDVVHFTVGDMDETGNATAQIQQSMPLDRGIGATEVSPREYR